MNMVLVESASGRSAAPSSQEKLPMGYYNQKQAINAAAAISAHSINSKMKMRQKNGKDDNSNNMNITGIFCAAMFGFFAMCIAVTFPSIMRTDQSENQRKVLENVNVNSILTKVGGSKPSPPAPLYDCTDEVLADYLSERPVIGMHVLCFNDKPKEKLLHITAYPKSELSPMEIPCVDVSYNDDSSSTIHWSALKNSITKLLALQDHEHRQPWAIFNPVGERLVGQEDSFGDNDDSIVNTIQNMGMVLLFEGGQWLWPGIKEGYRREIDLYSIMPKGDSDNAKTNNNESRKAVLETLSLQPLVLSVEGFLSPTECHYIEKKAEKRVSYSGVVLMDKDKDRPASDFRTSQSTFLASRGDDLLTDIDYRTASLVRIPRIHQEHVQVLRYGLSEKYDAHHDWFNPAYYQNDKNTLRSIQYGKRNRLATVFWYLSNVAKGGETNFPRYNGLPQPHNLAKCTQGLKVKPELGKVIIFYSLTADGAGDDYSLHAACPVEEGIKWAANKWVWNAPQAYV